MFWGSKKFLKFFFKYFSNRIEKLHKMAFIIIIFFLKKFEKTGIIPTKYSQRTTSLHSLCNHLVIFCGGSVGLSGDSYDIPLSTPASQGYKNNSLLSNQVQFFWHNSRPDTPTIQSGDGPIIETFIKCKTKHFQFMINVKKIYYQGYFNQVSVTLLVLQWSTVIHSQHNTHHLDRQK